MINRFREAVYQIFPRRGDATLDLVDGLTSEIHTESPVAVSESPLFRRGFSSIYDVLNEKVIDEPQLRQVLNEFQPADAEQIAGFEVYSLDCTTDPAPDAPTLPDRKMKPMPNPASQPDLFVLHSDADAPWVEEWLLPRLREVGLSVQTAEDFRIGRTVALNYKRAVSSSRYVAFVLSPAGLADRWAGFAASLARHRDPDNRTERVLPLLRAPCDELPGELADLRAADFTGARDPERELAKLIAIVSGAETPPPGPRQAAFFTVPFLRNADFVGRDTDLGTLHAALSGDGPVGILPAGLTGQGGMGKTALAVEYCHRHFHDHNDYLGGVFWVNAAEPLPQGFAALGCLLDPANFDRPVPRQIDAAARYLNSHPDALLVLDNVEDPTSLTRPVATGLIPTELACRLIFTTRRRDLPARCRPMEVTVLPEAAALSLLLRHPHRQPIQQPSHPEHAEARRICRRLGYLPLALEIAGAFLGEWPEIPLADFRARLEGEGALSTLDEEGAQLSSANLPAIHAAAVTATLRTQWDALDNNDAWLLLRIAGQLPEAAQIPTARLGLLAGLDGEERPGRPSRLQRALRKLNALSLVEELSGDELRLHPLVREFAVAQTPTSERDAFRVACAEHIHRAFSNFATLEGHCARRGVTALEADLTSAVRLLADPRSPISQSLQSLQRFLGRESHILRRLRRWETAPRSAYFTQQLRHRAVLDQEQRLMAESAAHLVDLAQPYLLLVWSTSYTNRELIRIHTGHENWVRSVAVTPDGRRAVSASSDYTLRIWDIATGKELALTANGRSTRMIGR